MKKKLSILAFTLLLAVGWTNVASAQKLDQGKAWYKTAFFQKMKQPMMTENSIAQPVEMSSNKQAEGIDGKPSKAPKRANYTITSNVVHPKSWYDAKHYTWYDVNGNEQPAASYTDVVTDSCQMFWFIRSLYTDPTMPGIKYTYAQDFDLAYDGCDFGYWISGDVTQDIYIQMTSYCYITLIRVYDYAGNVITEYDVDDGATPPSGWTVYSNNMTRTYENVSTSGGTARWYYWKLSSDYTSTFTDAFRISSSLLAGKGGVYVEVLARQNYSNSATRNRSFLVRYYDYNKQNYTTLGEHHLMSSSWDWYESMVHGPVTPPTENGYSVVLVKLKDDFDYETGQAEKFTYTDSALYNYYNKYVDEMQLLTDGMRLKEGTDDAGTLFTYSGMLNKFYFIGKGKTYPISGSENAWSTLNNQYQEYADRAPFYNMYEEFSPTTQSNTTGIDDFYSRMLEGDSYSIIHDCQSVNYMEHFFSMSGKGGTDPKSMTNLLFWIPDHRSQSSSRDYDEEYLPVVGLYTIQLTAEARPASNYSETNRNYDVTLNWVSSLNIILDFPVAQDYQLWVVVYNENNEPVLDSLLTTTHDVTTYTYQVPQYPDSYTIYYRVKGWPSGASNNPVNGGDFFALSNVDDVLIPGYENFLTLGIQHYESDFKIDEEHNYYRNFMTVGNQNPDDQLTASRVIGGLDTLTLYRFDVAQPGNLTACAGLKFFKDGNAIKYKITYKDQQILPGYDLQTLNIPTAGTIASIGGAASVDEYVKVTNQSDLTTGEYLIVYEGGSLAFDGSKTNPGASGTNATAVTINNNAIATTSAIDAINVTINVSDGTIRTASGRYIYRNSGTSGGDMLSPTTAPSNRQTFVIDQNGNAQITCPSGDQSQTYYLRFNSSSSQFRYYTTMSQQPIQLYKHVGSSNYMLLNEVIDNSTYTTSGALNVSAPWSATNVVLQSSGTSSGYFYIQASGNLKFTVPAGFNNGNLKFVVHNAPSTSSYYSGTFTFASSTGTTQTITCNTANRDYECIIPNVSTGDVITITGTCGNASYSPDFSYIHVYMQGGNGGVDVEAALNLAAIQFVDQFKAETKNDTHPYRYGYVLRYEPAQGNPKESGKPQVPVQHTGANMHGFYTLDEIQGDIDRGLDMNVMNAEVEMRLTTNPEVYYYTLDRKPSNVQNATWLEISQLQKREDDTYQEMDNLLTQYIDSVYNPVPTPRYDNYDVKLDNNWNDYMSYVPVVWTHGDLTRNKRIKWESEHLHNSYGAPIWKTGVGKVEILPQGTYAERQTGKNGSTNWVDENNDSCSLYMLVLDARGFLPTANTVGNQNGYVPYVPYWFNVYAASESGQLRGYNWVGEPGVDPENTGSPGSGVVNNTTTDRYLWHLWGGPTSDGVLTHLKSNTWAENWIFGALNNISDLEIIVRFYYVVDGMTGRDGGPAGYGSESPGFEPPTPTGIIENWTNRNIVSTTYVNPQGMQSDQPFDGINIVITRYDDGTTSTSKVIK